MALIIVKIQKQIKVVQFYISNIQIHDVKQQRRGSSLKSQKLMKFYNYTYIIYLSTYIP